MNINDGEVFKIFGYRFIIRYRKLKNRSFEIVKGKYFRGIHMGKLSMYFFHM